MSARRPGGDSRYPSEHRWYQSCGKGREGSGVVKPYNHTDHALCSSNNLYSYCDYFDYHDYYDYFYYFYYGYYYKYMECKTDGRREAGGGCMLEDKNPEQEY